MRKSIVQAMCDSAWMMKTSVEHGNICRALQEKKVLTGKYFQMHLFRYWMETMQ